MVREHMPQGAQLTIGYQLSFDDGEVVNIAVHLDPDSLALLTDPEAAPARWTDLSCNRCPVCCLPDGTSPSCPIAANISGLVEKLSQRFSYDRVRLQVTTEERTVVADTTLQAALSSLTGIFMVTSGCPTMDRLRPMVRFHLPLATEHETIYRASTMYLLGQYFRAQQGLPADWSLRGLDRIYREVHEVNRAFAERIREAAEHDANANALVRLDLFTGGVAQSTRASLADLNYLFAVADLPGPADEASPLPVSPRQAAGQRAPAFDQSTAPPRNGAFVTQGDDE